MSEELNGKVAIITGGSRGLGAASVRLFVREGAKVVIADILDEPGERLAAELAPDAVYRHTDVSRSNEVAALVDFTVSTFGGLDILFSNAGVVGQPQSEFLEEDFSDFHRTIDVDLLGPLHGARHAGAYMARHGGGCILTTASSAALYGGFSIIPYRAAKAGVVGMTKSLAIDLGRYGIRVNCISPGPTRTEMTVVMDDAPPDKLEELQDVAMETMLDRMPLRRMGTAEDIAEAALFLASDRAAQITGINLPVDGGETAGNLDHTLVRMQEGFARVLGAEGGS